MHENASLHCVLGTAQLERPSLGASARHVCARADAASAGAPARGERDCTRGVGGVDGFEQDRAGVVARQPAYPVRPLPPGLALLCEDAAARDASGARGARVVGGLLAADGDPAAERGALEAMAAQLSVRLAEGLGNWAWDPPPAATAIESPRGSTRVSPAATAARSSPTRAPPPPPPPTPPPTPTTARGDAGVGAACAAGGARRGLVAPIRALAFGLAVQPCQPGPAWEAGAHAHAVSAATRALATA